jgi:hypothetical protein
MCSLLMTMHFAACREQQALASPSSVRAGGVAVVVHHHRTVGMVDPSNVPLPTSFSLPGLERGEDREVHCYPIKSISQFSKCLHVDRVSKAVYSVSMVLYTRPRTSSIHMKIGPRPGSLIAARLPRPSIEIVGMKEMPECV